MGRKAMTTTFKHGAALTLALLGAPQVFAGPPSPSSWNLETTFSPGALPTSVAPWEARAATGANCTQDLGVITQPWPNNIYGAQVSGIAATTQPSPGNWLPLFFRNISTTSAGGSVGVVVAANQVAMHPGINCAVIRFVAPVNGIYKLNGEFFGTQGGAMHPSGVTGRILDKGVQIAFGPVSRPSGIHSWSFPGAQTYALQAGQSIDLVVDNGGQADFNSDTTLVSARVTWVDDLPNTIFKASDFDFEENHGCAVEQGTNKLYCWGQGTSSAQVLGTGSAVNQNKATLASSLQAFLATNNLGDVQTVHVGRYTNCVRTTTASTVCFGANNFGEALQPPGTAINNVTAALGAYNVLALDGGTGCISNAGQARCWGYNQINSGANGGLLGWMNGTAFTNSASLLAPVPNVAGATGVGPGGIMSCAVVGSAGNVICWSTTPWGPNVLGAGGALLANSGGVQQSLVKTATGDLAGVKKVLANGVHACAMTHGGQLYCWGIANYGSLTGAPIGGWSHAIARLVNFPGGVTDFALNNHATCVVSGPVARVYCQGQNVDGVVGTTPMSGSDFFTFNPALAGTSGANTVHANLQSGVPKPVMQAPNAPLMQVTKIRSGSMSATFCVLKANREIWCWGRGNFGQLGNGANAHSAVPVRVTM